MSLVSKAWASSQARGNVLVEVFLEGDVDVLGAVVNVQELDLADRRADRGDVQAVFVFQVADLLDLRLGELHHVLDAVADVDEAKAVVLQPQGGEGGELLLGRLLIAASSANPERTTAVGSDMKASKARRGPGQPGAAVVRSWDNTRQGRGRKEAPADRTLPPPTSPRKRGPALSPR